MTEKSWPAMTTSQAHTLLTAPGAPFEMETVDIRGRPTRVWKNAPPTLQHCFAAGRTHGDRIFLVHDGERVSFEGFARAALALAAHFRALGMVKGDRVAITMRNLPEWPVAFYAGQLVGAIVTPLNAWWTGAELEYGLADSGAVLLVTDAERWERIAPHRGALPALRHVLVARGGGEQALEAVIGPPDSWGSLPDVPTPAPFMEPEDDATIFYTSGTTGRPKGALGTHRNICCNVMATPFASARAFLRRGEQPPQPDPAGPQKAILLSVPFFHATGSHAVMNPALVGGAKLVLQRKFEPGEALALIERERVTSAGGVPTIAWQLLTHPERAKHDLSSLESISYGGAPSAPELVRQIGALTHAGNGWGMTETSATFSSHVGEDYQNRPDSAGPPCAVCDAEIRGPDGAVLPAGEVGELYGFGPNIVKGYWNRPDATAETFPDGWVRTGDLARMDDEGFITIVDRAKDMLIRGGENIYCVEVEGVLCEHPAVMDAALVGRPHTMLGEEPVAFVGTKPGMTATEAELIAFVAERLARFKVPVAVHIAGEPLPRNANGKVLKSELKARLG